MSLFYLAKVAMSLAVKKGENVVFLSRTGEGSSISYEALKNFKLEDGKPCWSKNCSHHIITTCDHCNRIGMKSNRTLKDLFEVFLLDPERKICGPGAIFSMQDHINLNSVLTDVEGYFVVFNNGGGKQFDIWKMESEEKIKAFVESEELKSYIYGYRIGNKDTVIKLIR